MPSPALMPQHCGHAQLPELCRSEAIEALSASRWLKRLPRSVLARLLDRPVNLFARRLAQLDERIADRGLAQASRWGLSQWTAGLRVQGLVNLPAAGPLLVVCNHPGIVDALAVLAQLGGHDQRLLVAERPLIRAMPALSQHLITVPEHPIGRGLAIRRAARHLRGGGTLVTFPAGAIEPDPAVRLQDALASLPRWSASTACMARLVPGVTIVPMVITGVLAARHRNHMLARQCADEAARDWLAATRQTLRAGAGEARPTLRIGRAILPPTAPTLDAALQQAMTALIRAA